MKRNPGCNPYAQGRHRARFTPCISPGSQGLCVDSLGQGFGARLSCVGSSPGKGPAVQRLLWSQVANTGSELTRTKVVQHWWAGTRIETLQGDPLQPSPCVAPPGCGSLATPTHTGTGKNPTVGKTLRVSSASKSRAILCLLPLWGLCKPGPSQGYP